MKNWYKYWWLLRKIIKGKYWNYWPQTCHYGIEIIRQIKDLVSTCKANTTSNWNINREWWPIAKLKYDDVIHKIQLQFWIYSSPGED